VKRLHPKEGSLPVVGPESVRGLEPEKGPGLEKVKVLGQESEQGQDLGGWSRPPRSESSHRRRCRS